MNLLANLSTAQIDLLAGALGFFFTVALLSYLLGDNPLYRMALHAFIGAAIGYIALTVWFQVIVPRLVLPLLSGNLASMLVAVVPMLLFALLIFKLSPTISGLGNISMAYLVGVGAAVAVGGAITGTLFPQVAASWFSLIPNGSLVNNLIIVIGTVTALVYFQFWLRGRDAAGEAVRFGAMSIVALIGKGFVVFTLGIIYGGLILSGVAALGGRLLAIGQWVTSLIS